MGELKNLAIGTVMLSVMLGLVFYYLFDTTALHSIGYGFLVTTTVIVFHEMVHKIVALQICEGKAKFQMTDFAIILTSISIVVIALLIVVKEATGFKTYFLPIVASPGAVFIDRLRQDNCIDNAAMSAPFTNFLVGAGLLLYLNSITDFPIIMNKIANPMVMGIALVSYFSLALAFFNSLPLSLFGVKLDGHQAIFRDRDDVVVLFMFATTLIFSFYILFLAQPFVIGL